MGLNEKISNSAEKGLGAAKEKAGEVLGKPDLEQEGRADQASAAAKQAGEDVKDAARKLNDGFGK